MIAAIATLASLTGILYLICTFVYDLSKNGFRLWRTRWYVFEPYWVDELWTRPLSDYRTDAKWRAYIDGKAKQEMYKKIG